MSPGFVPPMAHQFTDTASYRAVLVRIIEAIDSDNLSADEKCKIIDNRFDWYQSKVIEEIHRLKVECLQSQGLPVLTNKRRPDEDDDVPPDPLHPSPGTKKLRLDADDESPDDEVNAKGTWRCLYYEEDPETHFHCKDKRYKRVSELRRHIKTHTLPHYCERCGYRTAEERRLLNHKCDPSNRKKYSPVTEDDRQKHEQLARMGIKVGHMRTILFGKKSDGESLNGDDGTPPVHQTNRLRRAESNC